MKKQDLKTMSIVGQAWFFGTLINNLIFLEYLREQGLDVSNRVLSVDDAVQASSSRYFWGMVAG